MSKKYAYPAFAVMLVVVAALLGFQLQAGSGAQTAALPGMDLQLSGNPHVNKFQQALQLVRSNYFEEVDENQMVDDAIKGMLRELDPHTFFIPSEEMKQISEQMQGSFQGIGIEFNILEDTIYVVSPITGGPSEKLGILAGDRIVEIEGENVAGVGVTNNDVMKKLRGEKGSVVNVGIKRQGIAKLLEFDIERDEIPLTSVDYAYMVDRETGYIRVSRFAETTFREFQDKLKELKRKGMKNLVLDLRNNPGGYLDKAKMMADAFLGDDKMIVYTKGRIRNSSQDYKTSPSIRDFEEGGLVVLINHGSASASEIVSGSVQDWDRGLIIGTRSFGKGLVQQQYQLQDGSAIRVVVSRYYTPSGRCIQKPYNKGEDEYEMEVMERFENGELYDPDKIDFPDSLRFKTESGRVVYGGGGIMPDVFVPVDTTGSSEYMTRLFAKGALRTFSVRYIEHHPELKSRYKDGFDYVQNFQVSDATLQELIAYAEDKEIEFSATDYEKSRDRIRNNLKALIGRALYNDDGFYPVTLGDDPAFQRALELMPDARRLQRTGKFDLK